MSYVTVKHLIILDVIKIIIVQVNKSIMSFIIHYVANGTASNMGFWPYMAYLLPLQVLYFNTVGTLILQVMSYQAALQYECAKTFNFINILFFPDYQKKSKK